MNRAADRQQMLVDAFNHIQTAIELLDGAAAPGNIAANLDLSLHQLEAEMGRDLPGAAMRLDVSDPDFVEVWPSSLRPAH